MLVMMLAKQASSASGVIFASSSSTVSGSVFTRTSASSARERRILRSIFLPTSEFTVRPTSSSAAP